jgi:hypothetical protein
LTTSPERWIRYWTRPSRGYDHGTGRIALLFRGIYTRFIGAESIHALIVHLFGHPSLFHQGLATFQIPRRIDEIGLGLGDLSLS